MTRKRTPALRVILSRITYRYPPNAGPNDQAVKTDDSQQISTYQVGDHYWAYAAAPGTGYTEYDIVRIDQDGLWGRVLRKTVRELTIEEVR
jgi:hypothetical protein